MTENQLRKVTVQSRPGMQLLRSSNNCAETRGRDTRRVTGMQDRPGESMEHNGDASLRTQGRGQGATQFISVQSLSCV